MLHRFRGCMTPLLVVGLLGGGASRPPVPRRRAPPVPALSIATTFIAAGTGVN